MKTRVNKSNRTEINCYIIKQFDKISKKNKGKVSLIDLWNVQFEIEKKFNISDYQSQKLTLSCFWNESFINRGL